MHEQPADSESRLQARVVELETLYAHLERTLGDLDQAVLAQQRQIDALEKKAAALESDLNGLSGSPAPERKPEDEKPPHY